MVNSVHYAPMKGIHMNKNVTSKQEIIAQARAHLLSRGAEGFSMRAIAASCNVAVGSLYNYFPSKGALMGAVVGDIWQDVFAPFLEHEDFSKFDEALSCLCHAFQAGEERYPHFMADHALRFADGEKAQGRSMMHDCFSRLATKLQKALDNDESVREGVFDEVLTKEKFVTFVLKFLVLGGRHSKNDNEALIKMVQSSIY